MSHVTPAGWNKYKRGVHPIHSAPSRLCPRGSAGALPALFRGRITSALQAPTQQSSFIIIIIIIIQLWASLVAQLVKHPPAMQETWVRSLGWEDPLEEEVTTHSSVLAWRIPRTEEPDGLQSTGSQTVGRD